MKSAFEHGAGESAAGIGGIFTLLLLSLLLIAFMLSLIGLWQGWGDKELNVQQAMGGAIRAIVFLMAFVVIIGVSY